MEKAGWSGSHEGMLEATRGWLGWSIFKMGAEPGFLQQLEEGLTAL